MLVSKTALVAFVGFGAALAWLSPARAGNCRINKDAAPDHPLIVHAISLGPASADTVRRATGAAVAWSDAPISPAYVDLPRIVAEYAYRGAMQRTIAAALDGRLPPRGEAVTLALRHRDPDQPCSFIPVTIVPESGPTS